VSGLGPRRQLPEPDPGSLAAGLYAIWGAIGLSILAEFALLLYLQRERVVRIEDAGGPLSPSAHLTLFALLFLSAAYLVGTLRARLRDPQALARRGAVGPPARSPERPGPGVSPAGAPVVRVSAARAVAVRFLGLSVLQWAAAEALALVGLTLALALQPAPRLTLTLYFTLALALWLWSRPAPRALAEALRRADGRP
jgi:hypothetical protein